MRRVLSAGVILATLLPLMLVLTASPVGATTRNQNGGRFQHIFSIMMEKICNQPDLWKYG